MKEIIALIVDSRKQLQNDIQNNGDSQYWRGVLTVLNNYNFMLLLAAEMKNNNSISQTLENIGRLEVVNLYGNKKFNQDDMIE